MCVMLCPLLTTNIEMIECFKECVFFESQDGYECPFEEFLEPVNRQKYVINKKEVINE